MMDNRIFNVNGRGDDLLLKALSLSFEQKCEKTNCTGWMVQKEKGLILCWCGGTDDTADKDDGISRFPAPLTALGCMPFVISWLESDEAKTIDLGRMCGNADHDGHNEMGWQVYCGDWGHVGKAGWRAICAVRPAYMWLGK